MLTRLKVDGFKNLVGTDVSFGPFTCIAGPNGVGKSNLFDAIIFLSTLAEKTLLDSAISVRDEEGRAQNIQSIFNRFGVDHSDRMTFEAEMIIPPTGTDDLGQEARASITSVKYTLVLVYRPATTLQTTGAIRIEKEELTQINLQEARKKIKFRASPRWKKTAIVGRRTSPYISTVRENGKRIIRLHQDGNSGRTLGRSADELPRTVLSATNAAESPTALLVRREMQSWRLLQLEPSRLRRPDNFTAHATLKSDGSNLPATLHRLAHKNGVVSENESLESSNSTYIQIANSLSDLIEEVRSLTVEVDESRELYTIKIKDVNKTWHTARDLSDGTLRFLALAVLENDPESNGLVCLEEPENGIHPERIPAILGLLQAIALDPFEVSDSHNPLRQVIINTHSPAVVMQVPDDCLLMAQSKPSEIRGFPTKALHFLPLEDTWRSKHADGVAPPALAKGKLLSYLNPVQFDHAESTESHDRATDQRVIDRKDLQQYVFGFYKS